MLSCNLPGAIILQKHNPNRSLRHQTSIFVESIRITPISALLKIDQSIERQHIGVKGEGVNKLSKYLLDCLERKATEAEVKKKTEKKTNRSK